MVWTARAQVRWQLLCFVASVLRPVCCSVWRCVVREMELVGQGLAVGECAAACCGCGIRRCLLCLLLLSRIHELSVTATWVNKLCGWVWQLALYWGSMPVQACCCLLQCNQLC
jgi:hypothetical protein